MLAMVNIVSVDHSLQVFASFSGAPWQALVYDNIMENKIKNAITKNAGAYREHVGIIGYKRIVVKNSDGWEAEDKGEKIVSLE